VSDFSATCIMMLLGQMLPISYVKALFGEFSAAAMHEFSRARASIDSK